RGRRTRLRAPRKPLPRSGRGMRGDSTQRHSIQKAFVPQCTIPELRRLSHHRDGCNISTVISRRELAFITPIAPSPAGNGLAMRSFLFLFAARRAFAARALVVPVPGRAGPAPWAAESQAAVLDLSGGALPSGSAGPEPPLSPRWR